MAGLPIGPLLQGGPGTGSHPRARVGGTAPPSPVTGPARRKAPGGAGPWKDPEGGCGFHQRRGGRTLQVWKGTAHKRLEAVDILPAQARGTPARWPQSWGWPGTKGRKAGGKGRVRSIEIQTLAAPQKICLCSIPGPLCPLPSCLCRLGCLNCTWVDSHNAYSCVWSLSLNRTTERCIRALPGPAAPSFTSLEISRFGLLRMKSF